MCYAIVFESLRLLADNDCNENRDTMEMAVLVYNHYLKDYSCSADLAILLLPYYNSGELNLEGIGKIYKDYEVNDMDPYVYHDKEYAENEFKKLLTKMQSDCDILQLINDASEYLSIGDILKLNTSSGINIFQKNLYQIMMRKDDFNRLKYIDSILPVLPDKKLMQLIEPVYDNAVSDYVDEIINEIVKGVTDDRAREIAVELSKMKTNQPYKKYINNRFDSLLKVAFPVNAVNEKQMDTCVILLRILKEIDSNRVDEYMENLSKSSIDPIALYRCKALMSNQYL